MLTKDIAICIRTIDFSETSQIVTFFTRATGKISAIAKGSKRPKSAFGGPIEMFSFGEIVFSDSTKEKLVTLTEFQQRSLSGLANNFFALNCCLFAAELVNNLTQPYDPHPELFDSFLQFLENVEGEPRPVKTQHRASSIEHRDILSLLILFQLTLLREIGLMPILNACANCKTKYENQETRNESQKTISPATCGQGGRATPADAGAGLPPRKRGDEIYFSSSANGLICKDCEGCFPDKIRLTPNAAACLANLKHLRKSDEKTLKEIEKILISYFTGLLGHRPKMAKYLLKS